jgi:hypothetical protein
MKGLAVSGLLAAALISTISDSYCGDGSRLNGHWKLLPDKSASIDPWTDLMLDIHTDGPLVTVVKRYSAGHPHDVRVDSMTVNTQGLEATLPVSPGRWLGEVSMGIYYGPHAQRHVLAQLNESHNELYIDSHETLETAQGETEVDAKNAFTLSPDGLTMQWNETRSTRMSGPPMTYTFVRVTQW